MSVQVISGSDVSLGALTEQLGISVLADYIIYRGKSYPESAVEREEFLRWTREGSEITSSHPTAQDLLATFTEVGKKSSDILYIPIASRISKAYELALTVRERLPKLRVEVFDPKRPAGGHALITLEAARLANAGLPLDEILIRLNQAVTHIDQIVVVDSLRQLAREGRISNPEEALSSLIAVKALLSFRDGLPTPISKARTDQQALEQIIYAIKHALAQFDATSLRLIVEYTDNQAWVVQVADRLSETFSPIELLNLPASPLAILRFGTHGWSVAWEVER